MAKIKPGKFVDACWVAVNDKWGYIYGAKYERWTQEKQDAYVKKYANDPDRANSCKYGAKWIGHIVTDCSGLLAKIASDNGAAILHGSNSIWNSNLSSKGTISGGKRTDGMELKPATAVFTSSGDKHNHVGVYVGNGLVIEAQGAQAGVVTSLITNKKWTHWGELKAVDYSAGSDSSPGGSGGGGSKMEENYQAEVTGGRLSLREHPMDTSERLKWIPVGTILTVTDYSEEWASTTYGGKKGYVMREFLHPVGTGPTDQDEKQAVDAALGKIETAMKTISEQLEIISAINGRG